MGAQVNGALHAPQDLQVKKFYGFFTAYLPIAQAC
jgi:hypothetical protein